MKKSDLYLWKFVRGLKRFVMYLRRTYKNKILALMLILLGIGCLKIDLIEGAGAFIMTLVFAVPLFITNKNYTWF